MNKLNELKAERESLFNEQKSLAHTATLRGGPTAEETRRFQERSDRIDAIDNEISKLQRDAEAEKTFAQFRSNGGYVAGNRELNDELRQSVADNSRKPIYINPREYRSGYSPAVEMRDTTSTISTSTGSGLRGVSVYDQVVRKMVDTSSVMAAGATLLHHPTGEPFKIPRQTSDSEATVVAEGSTIPKSNPELGFVTLGSYKYAFVLQATHEMVNDAGFDLVGFLSAQAGQAMGNGIGGDLVAGTGAGTPGEARGILLDVSSVEGAATAPTVDELIDLTASVPEAHARAANAGWIMNKTTWAAIRKLKYTGGSEEYVVPLDGTRTLLGYPVFLDPAMPDNGAGALSILFGDLSGYYVRLVEGLRLERSDDFAFDSDVITWRCIQRADGGLVQLDAVVAFEGAGA